MTSRIGAVPQTPLVRRALARLPAWSPQTRVFGENHWSRMFHLPKPGELLKAAPTRSSSTSAPPRNGPMSAFLTLNHSANEPR